MVIKSKVNEIQIKVLDIDTHEFVEGAKLQIIQKNEGTQKVVKEFTTAKEAFIVKKLPIGEYILREVANDNDVIHSKGYVTSSDVEFIVMNTQEVQTVEMLQDYTRLEIEVTDIKNGAKIKDANFEIIQLIKQNDGSVQEKVVKTFVSTEENFNTTRLNVGDYILRQPHEQKEALLDKGYATLDDMKFTIEDTNRLQTKVACQDFTKLEIEVVDKNSKEKIIGAVFQIIKLVTLEDGTIKEEKICDFSTSDNNYLVERLGVGNYILRQPQEQNEAISKKGYASLKDINFEVKDTNMLQKLEVEQGYTRVEFSVKDKDTKEPVEGVVVQIVKQTKEMDESGNQVVKEEVVDEWTTEKDPHIVEKLPTGSYLLREKEINEEEGQVTTKDVEFTVENDAEVQKVEMIQSVTKLEIELLDKTTEEKIEGISFQIIRIKEGTQKEEIVKEFTTTKENHIEERLPIGSYILRQKEKGVGEKGYVKLKDLNFEIIDTEKTQKIVQKQDYTKLEVTIVDKKTKEGIIGATLEIQDEKGKQVGESWISDGKAHNIERIPVGEYTLVQLEAPELRGYIKSEPLEFEVKEIEEIQKVEMIEDYTKTEVTVKDEETGEDIPGVKLEVKDKNGNTILEVEPNEEGKSEIEKLPVGEYIVETKNEPEGYKHLKEQIEIGPTNDGKIELQLEREEFDIQVETWIQQISRNGKVTYTNKKEEQKVSKIDIKDKKIKTEDIRITYKIRVKNISKITGQVGRVVASIPAGMQFKKEDNKNYWKEENGKVITTGLAGRDIKAGSHAEIEITLRWKNGLENFGTKKLTVAILEVTSKIGFKETNLQNNIANSADTIIGVSTGEMNLVWATWGLLIALILLEIFITKKLKIKRFRIKDKTLKYTKKNKS